MINTNENDNDHEQPYSKKELMSEDSLRIHTSTMDHWISDPSQSVVPLRNDVLCGRGKTAYHHSGNQSLQRDMVRRLEDFQAAESRFEKSIIVRDCIQCVLNRGGRFLKKNASTGHWYPTGFNDARDKVSHALRNNAGRGFKHNDKSYSGSKPEQKRQEYILVPYTKNTYAKHSTIPIAAKSMTLTQPPSTISKNQTTIMPVPMPMPAPKQTTTTITTVKKIIKTITSPGELVSSSSFHPLSSSNDTVTTSTTTTTIVTTSRNENGEEVVEKKEMVTHESSLPETTVTTITVPPPNSITADKIISSDVISETEQQQKPSLLVTCQQEQQHGQQRSDETTYPRTDSTRSELPISLPRRRPRRGMKQWPVGDPAEECFPQPNDVLCGRGKKAYQHQGNQRLQLAIGMKTADFKATSSRAEKSLMVHNLIQSVLDRGGRFLKKDLKAGTWYMAGFNDAREKISHAFRNSPHIRSDLCIAVSGLCSLSGAGALMRRKEQQTIT